MNNKGFTLMEMLIVVAIIAVLAAIGIPTMTASVEKAREAVDLSNLRAAYSEIVNSVELGEVTSSRLKKTSGTIVTSVKCVSTKDKWQMLGGSTSTNIAGIQVSAPNKDKPYIRVKYYYTGENAGKFTFTRLSSPEYPVYNK